MQASYPSNVTRWFSSKPDYPLFGRQHGALLTKTRSLGSPAPVLLHRMPIGYQHYRSSQQWGSGKPMDLRCWVTSKLLELAALSRPLLQVQLKVYRQNAELLTPPNQNPVMLLPHLFRRAAPHLSLSLSTRKNITLPNKYAGDIGAQPLSISSCHICTKSY